MAIESIRRSGYRVVGGIYLVSDTYFKTREILPLPTCRYCGQGPNLSRNITEIKWGELQGSFLALVGKHFYPTIKSFLDEAEHLGVSKRVPFVAKHIILNKTKIYLAHPLAFKRDWGIFAYFIPERIEQLFWAGNGPGNNPTFTYIRVPDGDLDHSAWKGKRLLDIY